MESAPICHIDKLPNEILRVICSLLAPSNEWNLVDYLPPYIASSILAIRCVSRRFRMISDDLQFWHEDSFDFSDLCCDTKPRQLGRRIRKLLDDDNLKLVLSRKSGWQFSCIQALFATAASLPGLSRNTRSITLSYFEGDDVENAIYFLAGFTAVTQLTIDYEPEGDTPPSLDFGIIVESCPLLETLVITYLRYHDGSLAKAAKLQKVDITFFKPECFFQKMEL